MKKEEGYYNQYVTEHNNMSYRAIDLICCYLLYSYNKKDHKPRFIGQYEKLEYVTEAIKKDIAFRDLQFEWVYGENRCHLTIGFGLRMWIEKVENRSESYRLLYKDYRFYYDTEIEAQISAEKMLLKKLGELPCQIVRYIKEIDK